MFNLTQEINKWGEALQNTNSLREDDVQEMKSHLVATIDDLVSTELSEEEAFLVATHRLGDFNLIQSEYKKVNLGFVWRRRLIWLISGYFIFTLVPYIVHMLASPIYFFQIDQLLYPSLFLYEDGYSLPFPVHVLALIIFTALLVSLMRNEGKIHSWIKVTRLSPKLVIWIISGFVAGSVFQIASYTMLANTTSIDFVKQAAMADGFFSLSWQIFMVITLIVTVSLQRRQNRLQFA